MKSLLVETATSAVGVGIADEGRLIASATLAMGSRHAEQLVPMTQRLCEWAGCDLADLSYIVVDVGPGLFSGLRVGVSSAKAFGMALDIPLVGVSSLDALAWPHRHFEGIVLAALDARRGQVYWARHSKGGGAFEREGPPRNGTPLEMLQDLSDDGRPCLAVGDGALRYSELLSSERGGIVLAGEGGAVPSLVSLASLGVQQMQGGASVDAMALLPCYVRPPDAKVPSFLRSGAT